MFVIVGIGIPDGRFVIQGDVGVGMLKWQTSVPLSRLAGEGDKGGEGNKARLPVHACTGENSPRCRDSVPNRCTLVRFVSLSRGAGEGERAAPLAHFVGEEPGLRATKLLNPRKIPLNFPRIAPSPLDIRAKMCYTIDVNGATPE